MEICIQSFEGNFAGHLPNSPSVPLQDLLGNALNVNWWAGREGDLFLYRHREGYQPALLA